MSMPPPPSFSGFPPSTTPAAAGGRFSRRTVLAAIEILDRLSQAEFSRLLRHFGPNYRNRIRGEEVSLAKRLNDLIDLLDAEPGARIDGGELLSETLVEKAAANLRDPTPWGTQEEFAPHAALRRALLTDGYEVTGGAIRRSLPTDIGLPQIEDQVRRLLDKHGLGTAKGHLDQALDAHTRGDWSAANGQLRNVLDSVLDELAAKVDPSAAALATGQPRRTKLAAAGFLSTELNEWSDNGCGFLNGLVRRLHPQGAHPGLSDDEDSTFRLHLVLLTARLFLVRYDRGRRPAGS